MIFTTISLAPAALLALGGLLGGAWVWAAFVYMAFLAALADKLPLVMPGGGGDDDSVDDGGALLWGLGTTAIALGPVVIWALTSRWSGLEWIAGFAAAGLWYGQVATSAAHEMIHRSGRGLFRLGAAVFTMIGFGHHVSAHRLVHHAHVATPLDPNSAPRGRGYYRFFLDAWAGSYAAGLRAERRRANGAVYLVWTGGALAVLALAWAVFGWQGAAVWAAVSLHAQSQLLLSDYIQHYGLRRDLRPDGRYAPAGTAHSWNAPHWFTSALTLNAPRHSDHHANPARPFPALRLAQDAPLLPAPVPVMGVLALVPPLWRRIMDPRVRALRDHAAM